jgi:hypothetical protein
MAKAESRNWESRKARDKGFDKGSCLNSFEML